MEILLTILKIFKTALEKLMRKRKLGWGRSSNMWAYLI